ncbi:MAG: energy transducer TonB [Opitutales bacterium]
MNNIVYRLTLIIGLLAAPLALSAKSPEQAYLDQYRGRTDMPVPVKIVTPSISNEFSGLKISLEFTVDASGIPQQITTSAPVPSRLAAALTEAVGQWRFQPLSRNGQAVPAHIILPLAIVDSQD